MTEPDGTLDVSTETRSPPPLSWPRRIGLTAAGLAVAVGFYTVYWLFAAQHVRGGIEAWIADRAGRGLAVSFESLDIDGFPFRINIRAAKPAALWTRGYDSIEWNAANLNATLRPWRLNVVDADLSGRHRFTSARAVALEAGQLDLRVVVGRRGAFSIHVAAADIDAEISAAGSGRMAKFKMDAQWTGSPGSDGVPLRLDLGADGVVAPDRWATPFGGDIAAVRLAGSLTGRIEELRDPDFLKTWRDGGGTVEIAQLALTHGPADLQSSGTLALDKDLQPIGAMTARMEGFMETVDALSQARLIGAGEATAAKLVLAVIAKRPSGRPPFIEAPLTLQDRTLSVDKIKLLEIPVVDWTPLVTLLAFGG